MNITVIVCFTICIVAILAFSALVVLYYQPGIKRLQSRCHDCLVDFRLLSDNFFYLKTELWQLRTEYDLCEKHVRLILEEMEKGGCCVADSE